MKKLDPSSLTTIVYTWVDLDWPGHADAIARYSAMEGAAKHKGSHDKKRYRDDFELLRYSLRSVDRYAPFLKRVVVVTARPQVPHWLNTEHPDVQVVHHDEIFADPANLPCFSSRPIELAMHRIPGLTEPFLYLNDDMLFGGSVAAEDFISPTAGRVRLYRKLSQSTPASRFGHPGEILYSQSRAYTNGLMDKRYGRRRRPSLGHGPLVFVPDEMARAQSIWSEEVRATETHRFRHPNDVLAVHLMPNFLYHEGMAEYVSPWLRFAKVGYLGLDNRRWNVKAGLGWIARIKPKYFCLNDDFGDDVDPEVERYIRRWLEKQYPAPSRFEKQSDAQKK